MWGEKVNEGKKPIKAWGEYALWKVLSQPGFGLRTVLPWGTSTNHSTTVLSFTYLAKSNVPKLNLQDPDPEGIQKSQADCKSLGFGSLCKCVGELERLQNYSNVFYIIRQCCGSVHKYINLTREWIVCEGVLVSLDLMGTWGQHLCLAIEGSVEHQWVGLLYGNKGIFGNEVC